MLVKPQTDRVAKIKVIGVGVGGNYALTSMINFFFFNDTATTDIYTLSLHDALPIFKLQLQQGGSEAQEAISLIENAVRKQVSRARSEEHTSVLQSLAYIVCHLL